MRIFVDILGEELKKIERLIKEGKATSVNNFVRQSVTNQLKLEEIDTLETYSEMEGNLLSETKKERIISGLHFFNSDIHLPAHSIPKEHLKQPNIKLTFPFWATQNRYFGTKVALRLLERELDNNNSESMPFYPYAMDVAQISVKIREILEKLDKKLGRKKGSKFSTSLPKAREASIKRFISQFLGYISSNGVVSGVLPEIGFVRIDTTSKEPRISITEHGHRFSELPSPILDEYFINGNLPNAIFSDKEREFLLSHIKEEFMYPEADFIKFTLYSIYKGHNTPDALTTEVDEYLNKNYSHLANTKKEGHFSDKEIIGMRAGVTSRLLELGLININIIENKSNYSLTERGKNFLRSDK